MDKPSLGLTEVVDDDKTVTKASCSLCDDVQLVYMGGTSNLFTIFNANMSMSTRYLGVNVAASVNQL